MGKIAEKTVTNVPYYEGNRVPGSWGLGMEKSLGHALPCEEEIANGFGGFNG
jgi:hypothetical protein